MENKKICPNCGHQTEGNAKFCNKCGTKMVEMAAPKKPEEPKVVVQAPEQSETPKKKKGKGWITALVIVLLLAVAAFFAAPKIVDLYQELTGQTEEEDEKDGDKSGKDKDKVAKEEEETAASKYDFVHDEAKLLVDDDCEYLNDLAKSWGKANDMEIYVVTADNLDGATTKKYAQKMCSKYIQDGFGFVVLVDMDNRGVYVGQEGDVVSEEIVDMILKDAIPYLKDEEYCDAIDQIMTDVVFYYENPEEAVALAEEGIHRYELIVADKTWSQAYQDCLNRGGYLVRINSDEEYQAILNQIKVEKKDNIKFWLGAKRASVDSKEYRWVYEDGSLGAEVINGNAKYASYWLENEPSFYDESVKMDETCLNMFYLKRANGWIWNDVPNDILSAVSTYKGTIGYICEYEN